MDVKNAVESVQAAVAQMRAENDRRLAEIEKKGYASAETEQKVERLNARITELQAQLDETQKRASRVAGASAADDEKSAAAREHRAAFGGFLRRGENEMALRGLEVKAALSTSTGADGGYIVPQDLDRALAEQALKLTPMRECCTVVTVSSEKYEKLVNVHGLAGGWVAEGDARPATNSPQFFQFKPLFGEMYANVSASQRVLDDGMFDLEGHIASEAAKTFALLENAAFTTGAGVAGTSPKGFLAYTPSLTPTFGTNIGLVKSGTAGVITPDTLIDVPAKLLASYRAGSTWMMAAGTLAAVRKLKDTQNRYLWEPSLQAGSTVGGTLLGYPIVENEDMPAVAASANAIAFGNFKRACVVADVVGTRLLRDPFTNKPNVMFYMTKRVGHGVIDTSALLAYQLAV